MKFFQKQPAKKWDKIYFMKDLLINAIPALP